MNVFLNRQDAKGAKKGDWNRQGAKNAKAAFWSDSRALGLLGPMPISFCTRLVFLERI